MGGQDRDRDRCTTEGGALAALQTWAEENGLEVEWVAGATKFSADTIFLKLKIKVLEIDPNAELAEAFRTHAHTVGLAPSDLGKVFEFRLVDYVLVGMRPSAHKYPIVAKENWVGGDLIKLPADAVRDALAAGGAA